MKKLIVVLFIVLMGYIRILRKIFVGNVVKIVRYVLNFIIV